MEKQTISVPGIEELGRPRSRKDFLKVVATAGVGATVGTALFTRKAGAQAAGGDAEILNFALTLEYLEAAFYERALNSGVLSGNALAVVQNLFEHESAHVDVLIAAIQGLGATPVAPPEFTFPADALASEAAVLNTAITLEPVGVGAYIGAAPMISDPTLLEVAGSIVGVEGEHVTAVQWLLGVVPPANEAFPESLTQDQVLAAIAPFVGGAMPETGGEAPAYGTGKAY